MHGQVQYAMKVLVQEAKTLHRCLNYIQKLDQSCFALPAVHIIVFDEATLWASYG